MAMEKDLYTEKLYGNARRNLPKANRSGWIIPLIVGILIGAIVSGTISYRIAKREARVEMIRMLDKIQRILGGG